MRRRVSNSRPTQSPSIDAKEIMTTPAATGVGHLARALGRGRFDTLARVVRGAFERADDDAMALIASSLGDDVSLDQRWTYGELRERAETFARALRDLGYAEREAKALGVRARNGGDALTAYLGGALAGSGTRTCGAREDAREAFGNGKTRGTMVEFVDADVVGSIVGAHEPIALNGGTVKDKVILYEVLRAAYGRAEDDEDGDATTSATVDARYMFGGDKVTSGMTLASAAARAAAALDVRETDAVCVPVPLGHAMGFGFGALAALTSGARLVLPPTMGSAADGDAARRAMFEATLEALRSEKCTLVVADSHVTRSANELAPDLSGLDALRGGLVKVGSGDDVGMQDPVKFLGVDLLTVGVAKPK